MSEELTDNQLYIIMSSGRDFQTIENKLSEPLEAELLELQQRAGNLLADHHSWQAPEGYPDMTTNPEPITHDEANRILTSAYEELRNGRDKMVLARIMKALDIEPPSQETQR